MMSMSGYTKLFNSILASTIWREPNHVRIVWITLLAMADKHGVAEGSMPGLADFARVSLEDCADALRHLQEPDEHSRSQEFEGRRIMPIDGGWQILNHAKYREKMTDDERREYLRIKQAEYRAKKKTTVSDVSTGVANVSDKYTELTQAEAEAEADTHSEAETKQKQQKTAAPASRPERLRSDGPLAGTFQKDHLNHAFCGSRFCVTRKHFAGLARTYGDGGELALTNWLNWFDAQMPSDTAYGGPVWLSQHWDAHLVQSGRVAPAPAAKPETAWERMKREAREKAAS